MADQHNKQTISNLTGQKKMLKFYQYTIIIKCKTSRH